MNSDPGTGLDISICDTCKSAAWPPNKICSKCFGITYSQKSSNIGRLVEFSKNKDTYFGLVEFDYGIRIICSMSQDVLPQIGQRVRLVRVTVRKFGYDFECTIVPGIV